MLTTIRWYDGKQSGFACMLIDKYKLCSETCDDNRRKLVQKANLEHWNTICQVLFSIPQIFDDFISCQKEHLDKIERRCPQPLVNQDPDVSALGNFCRKMRLYAKCYAETKFRCSKNATIVHRKITGSINAAFIQIQELSRGHLNIPNDCEVLITDNARDIAEERHQHYKSSDNSRGSDHHGDSANYNNGEVNVGLSDYWIDAEGNDLEMIGNENSYHSMANRSFLDFNNYIQFLSLNFLLYIVMI